MKKIVFILIIAAYSCNKSEPAKVKVAETPKTRNEIMEANIKEYLMNNLDNPASYQPDYTDTLNYMKPDHVWRKRYEGSVYYMHHRYRATNQYNAVIKVEGFFFADTNLNILRQMTI